MNKLAFLRPGRDAMQGVRRAAVPAGTPLRPQAVNNTAGRPLRPKKTSKLVVDESLNVLSITSAFPRPMCRTASPTWKKQNDVFAGIDPANVTARYDVALDGCAAMLTDTEVRAFKKNIGVLSIQADTFQLPHTSSTPAFLGLDQGTQFLLVGALARSGGISVRSAAGFGAKGKDVALLRPIAGGVAARNLDLGQQVSAAGGARQQRDQRKLIRRQLIASPGAGVKRNSIGGTGTARTALAAIGVITAKLLAPRLTLGTAAHIPMQQDVQPTSDFDNDDLFLPASQQQHQEFLFSRSMIAATVVCSQFQTKN